MKKLLISFFVIACLTSFILPQDNKPKAKYKVGAAIITVWENKRDDGSTWKSFKVEKLYKKDDKWETSNSFNERELLQLKEAIEQAIKEEGVKGKE